MVAPRTDSATDVARRFTPVAPHTPPPFKALRTAALAAAGIGLLTVTVLTIAETPFATLSQPGGPATFIGTLTGMVGTYLALLMVLLVSRLAPVESVLGQDGLVRWHRRLAPWPITLLTVHAVSLTLGYAQAAKTGAVHEFGTLMSGYADVLAAAVGLGLMLLAGVVSVRAIRQRLRRETWWVIHLYLYLALALSFAHALVLGPTFVGHPLTRIVWSVAWAATAGVVLTFRWVLPLARSLYHDLVVENVYREARGVVSISLRGRHLDRLPVHGGQFALWRFMTRGMWWQAHPYSISGLPRSGHLRLTVKEVGDHSRELASLRPGTRVFFEGPYGAFTARARHRSKAALVAAGIGVTSLRTLLEDLPAGTEPVVILRARSAEEMPLRDEIVTLVERRGGTLHELYGSRNQHVLDGRRLRRLVPDLVRRDVYICGPESFVGALTVIVKSLGVPEESVHHEAYAL